MKTGAKVGITVAVIIVLLMCCCSAGAVGWYFGFGPGSYQTTQANKLTASANKKYTTAIDLARQMQTSASDMDSKLAKDTSTASIQNFKDEAMKLESKAQEIIDELDSADKDLTKARKLRMPEWYQTYIDKLIERDKACKTGLELAKKAFAEGRDMAGSLSYVIDGVDRITTAFTVFDQITAAMSANDYAGALAKINEADASLSAAETALKTANETMNSKDIVDVITVSEKFREVLQLMTRFIQAAQALDLTTMTSLQTQLTSKLGEATAAADAVGATNDFGTWFEKSLKKYSDEVNAEFTKADKLERDAEDIFRRNNS